MSALPLGRRGVDRLSTGLDGSKHHAPPAAGRVLPARGGIHQPDRRLRQRHQVKDSRDRQFFRERARSRYRHPRLGASRANEALNQWTGSCSVTTSFLVSTTCLRKRPARRLCALKIPKRLLMFLTSPTTSDSRHSCALPTSV